MRYFVESYGCTMNYGEGRELAEKMRALGHVPSDSPDDADVIILNTCTVIGTTEKKMLRRMSEIEQSGKDVIVTGCMAKAQAERIASCVPNSVILPPDRYAEFEGMVSEKYGSSGLSASVSLPSPPSPSADAGISAILPIAQGCIGNCAYCITKIARGDLKSYSVNGLSSKFENMIRSGAREILVTAQDTGCYGTDIGTDLPSLLSELLKISGEYRIRIGMMNPGSLASVSDRLMNVMDDERIYKFLHVPVQSGSDTVLKRMNRPYTVSEFKTVIEKVRSRYPDMSISTDIITGFPGETGEDHKKSKELLEWLSADTVNVTRFSPRSGTAAYGMSDQIHGRISKERSRELVPIRAEAALERNRRMIGRTYGIMITETGKSGTVMARTDNYRLVVLNEDAALGTAHSAEITEAKHAYVLGKIVKQDASTGNHSPVV